MVVSDFASDSVSDSRWHRLRDSWDRIHIEEHNSSGRQVAVVLWELDSVAS